MLALFRKELRGLLPLLLLILIFQSGDILTEPFTRRPDEICWGSNSSLSPGHGTEVAIEWLLLGFLAAFSLFPREHEERTIEYLYGLPVSRPSIFFAKVGAAVAIVWIGVFWGLATSVVLASPNHETLGGDQFRLGLAVEVGLLHSAFATIVVCYGVLLSFLRRFGLVLFAVFAWAIIALKEAQPSLAFLDGTRICDLEYQGTHLVLPTHELLFHGVMAAVSLALAYVVWMGPAERAAQGFMRLLETTAGKMALGCGGFLAIALLISLVVYSVARGAGEHTDAEIETRHTTWATARAETRHYDFTYLVSNRDAALELIRSGDGIFESVARALGARTDAKIVADLTETSGEHAGIAGWQKIRIDLRSEQGPAWLRHVLAHETTHAFEFQESERKLQDNHPVTQFFIEGLAERIAFTVEPRPEALAGSRLVAAAAWRRGHLRFDDLATSSRLRARHDPNLVYMLGETWCAALEKTYGPEAAGTVLRSMARPDAPRDLAALPFWQDTLQAAGFNLERVNAAWAELLTSVEAAEKDELQLIPRLTGSVIAVDPETVTIRATADRVPRGRTLVRTRESETTPDTRLQIVGAEPAPEGARSFDFKVPRWGIESNHLEFQVGQQVRAGTLDLWEDWQTATIH